LHDSLNDLQIRNPGLALSVFARTWRRDHRPKARNIRTRGAFDIAATKGYFYECGAKYIGEPGRASQTYVFAWNPTHGEKADHRDAGQWEFYVAPESALPVGRKTIALSRIKTLNPRDFVGI
jgi:hypothetical protein